MARERDDDYADDVDDDYDDRPRRRRPSGNGAGPLDKMYADTNVVVLVLFGLCCGGIAFVLSLIAFLTAKDPKAKSNAMLVMVIGGVMMVVGITLNVIGVFAGAGGR